METPRFSRSCRSSWANREQIACCDFLSAATPEEISAKPLDDASNYSYK